MGFTVNQVRHFYTVCKPKEGSLVVKHEGTEVKDKLKDSEAKGAVKLHINKAKDHLYFEYMSPAGQVRTDLIHISKIAYLKHTKAKDMRYPLKQFKVSFDKEADFKGDFITNVVFKRFLSLSEDSEQIAIAGHIEEENTSPSEYFKNVAYQLAKTIEKSFTGMIKVELETGGSDAKTVATTVPVTSKTKLKDLTDTYTGIVLTELPQPWKRGLHPQGIGIDFEVVSYLRNASPKTSAVVEEIAKDLDNRAIKNGFKIADMEYHYHGERGDIYRENGYPYIIETEYVTNPESEYDTLDIHYAFEDQGTSAYHSEKDLTIAACDDEIEEIFNAIKEVIRGEEVTL